MSRQHVLNFRSADSEGECAECSVGAGVAVTADNSHAGLREPQLRANHMHNSLLGRIHVEQANAEFAAIFLQGFDLLLRYQIKNRCAAGFGGNVVINRRNGPVWRSNFTTSGAQTIKRLWRRDLMHQVQVHIYERWLARGAGNDVLVPNFFEESTRHA